MARFNRWLMPLLVVLVVGALVYTAALAVRRDIQWGWASGYQHEPAEPRHINPTFDPKTGLYDTTGQPPLPETSIPDEDPPAIPRPEKP
jgi:hypothetical protein